MTTGNALRIQTDRVIGDVVVSFVTNVKEGNPSQEAQDAVDNVIKEATQATGLSEQQVASIFLTWLMERDVNQHIYEEECARRGVLAL